MVEVFVRRYISALTMIKLGVCIRNSVALLKFALTSLSVELYLCRNASAVSTCVQNIMSPDDMGIDAKTFFMNLRDEYIFGCSAGLCFLIFCDSIE